GNTQIGAKYAAGPQRWEIILRADVGNVKRAMFAYPAKLWRIHTYLEAKKGYGTKMSTRNHSVSLAESQHHVIDPTDPCRALNDSIQDRLHVRGRAANDAKHLCRCRLMLQRLAQFRIALLDLLEQPHVLDSDAGLVGEGFEEGYLLIRE